MAVSHQKKKSKIWLWRWSSIFDHLQKNSSTSCQSSLKLPFSLPVSRIMRTKFWIHLIQMAPLLTVCTDNTLYKLRMFSQAVPSITLRIYRAPDVIFQRLSLSTTLKRISAVSLKTEFKLLHGKMIHTTPSWCIYNVSCATCWIKTQKTFVNASNDLKRMAYCLSTLSSQFSTSHLRSSNMSL